MNKEYLWDKTGHDTDIEKLENALSVFRLQESNAPSVPLVKSMPPRAQSRGLFLKLAFAGAAAVILIITVLQFSGLRYLAPDGDLQVGIDPVSSNNPPMPIIIPADQPETADTIASATPKVKRTSLRPMLDKRSESRVRKAGNPNSNSTAIELTAEEQYAYDQLMLALSITSSKLKLVKDKVAGIEPIEIVIEKNSDPQRRN